MVHPHGKSDWTDIEHVERMAKSYSIRYDKEFWSAFESLTGRASRPIVADFGCGPGLLLTDIVNRFNAHTAIALDESEQMLALAATNLKERTTAKSTIIQKINFDTDTIPIEPSSIDFAFSGFMLHEVASPSNFVSQVFKLVNSNGLYTVYDFVSGNEEMFVKSMSNLGMDEEHARKRYPHMCKHSADDIVEILKSSGFSECSALIISEVRAVVVGLKR